MNSQDLQGYLNYLRFLPLLFLNGTGIDFKEAVNTQLVPFVWLTNFNAYIHTSSRGITETLQPYQDLFKKNSL